MPNTAAGKRAMSGMAVVHSASMPSIVVPNSSSKETSWLLACCDVDSKYLIVTSLVDWSVVQAVKIGNGGPAPMRKAVSIAGELLH